MTPAPKLKPSMRRCARLPCPGLASDSALSDSTGNTHGMRFSTRPPTNANTIAASERDLLRQAARDVERRRGAAAGFGAGDDGADQRRRRASSRAPAVRRCANPLADVSTPATSREARHELVGDRQRQHERAVRLAHQRLLAGGLDAAFLIREEVHGRGVAAPAGRSASSTTFCPSPRGVGEPARARLRGSASRVAAIALPHCGYGIRALARPATRGRAPPLRGCRSRGTPATPPCAASVSVSPGCAPARDVDVRQQQHLAFVAVVDERSGGQARAAPATGSGRPPRPAAASRRSLSAGPNRPGSASTCASRRPS